MTPMSEPDSDEAAKKEPGVLNPIRLARSLVATRAAALGRPADELPRLYLLATIAGDYRLAFLLALIPFGAWIAAGWLGLGALLVTVAAVAAVAFYFRNRD